MVKIIDGNLFDSKANIICHQCNCQGVMGSGVAAEVKRRYPEVFKEYQDFCKQRCGVALGNVLFVHLKNEKRQIIANLMAQDKYGRDKCYTDYDALRKCLSIVRDNGRDIYSGEQYKVAFPYGMGSVRGGGDWNTVYQIIDEELGRYYDVEIWMLDKG